MAKLQRLTAAKMLLAACAVAACVIPPAGGVAATNSWERALSPLRAPGKNDLPGADNPDDLLAQRYAEQRQPRHEVPFNPEDFDKFTGYYFMDPYTVVHIRRLGHRYLAELSTRATRYIYPESPTKFFLEYGPRRAFQLPDPAQISFTLDAGGHVAGMVLHQHGLEYAASPIDEAQAKALNLKLRTHIETRTEFPGTRDGLARYIAGLQSGHPDYAAFTPEMADVIKTKLSGAQGEVGTWGALKWTSFRRTSRSGADIYWLKFEHADVQCGVLPPDRQGRIIVQFCDSALGFNARWSGDPDLNLF